MKSIFFFLVLLPALLLAQSEQESYKKRSSQFEQHYNDGEYDKIFALYSQEMKDALPLDNSNRFFSGLKFQVGNIKEREFVRYQNTTYALYKTNFERGTFAVNISVNVNGEINGLFVKPFVDEVIPAIERNKTPMILPFNDEWTVFWGGDTREQNYHVDNPAQKGAFDWIITDDRGKSFQGSGTSNENYYAFGKEIIAPCDGEVILVVDGIKDNIPGEMNPAYLPGNTVILKTANDEFLFFAHFKQYSIVVKPGQKVRQGELLGKCGNSGNSSEAHLHFHLQNTEDFSKATGGKTYFERILVNSEMKEDYSPLKGEKVKN